MDGETRLLCAETWLLVHQIRQRPQWHHWFWDSDHFTVQLALLCYLARLLTPFIFVCLKQRKLGKEKHEWLRANPFHPGTEWTTRVYVLLTVKIMSASSIRTALCKFIVIFPHVLFHFSFTHNHKVGGARCHPHFTDKEWSHRKLPKQKGTLSIPPCSRIKTANI